MTDESETLSEREEIEALLPWYATRKLDATSLMRVESYLERHPDMRRQLALIEQDRDVAARANAAITPPSTLRADRVLERARGPVPASAARPVWTAVYESLRDFFGAPSASGVRWAAAAAAVVVLAQVAIIGGLIRERPQGGYETASGGTAQAQDGVRVLVRFKKEARIDAVAAALAGLDMRIVDGPKPGELFDVRIADAAATELERAARIAKLRDLPLVEVVVRTGP